jgi:hypothetical protein
MICSVWSVGPHSRENPRDSFLNWSVRSGLSAGLAGGVWEPSASYFLHDFPSSSALLLPGYSFSVWDNCNGQAFNTHIATAHRTQKLVCKAYLFTPWP